MGVFSECCEWCGRRLHYAATTATGDRIASDMCCLVPLLRLIEYDVEAEWVSILDGFLSVIRIVVVYIYYASRAESGRSWGWKGRAHDGLGSLQSNIKDVEHYYSIPTFGNRPSGLNEAIHIPYLTLVLGIWT